jgi:hypothetical protein
MVGVDEPTAFASWRSLNNFENLPRDVVSLQGMVSDQQRADVAWRSSADGT